jgi:hypothetical protein
MNFRWIIFGLIGVFLVTTIYRNEMAGAGDPPWTRCKESLVVQIFTGDCTLRFGGTVNPA